AGDLIAPTVPFDPTRARAGGAGCHCCRRTTAVALQARCVPHPISPTRGRGAGLTVCHRMPSCAHGPAHTCPHSFCPGPRWGTGGWPRASAHVLGGPMRTPCERGGNTVSRVEPLRSSVPFRPLRPAAIG